MADTKTSALAALSAIVDADLLMMLDVSDTSMASSGTNKKVTAGDFKAYINANTIIGSGMPEGVVVGTVGNIYADTAATNGAVLWVKKSGSGSSGWKVVYGDTGMRQILVWDATGVFTTGTGFASTDLAPRSGNAGWVRISRMGDDVKLWWIQVQAGASGIGSGTDVPIVAIPAGFGADVGNPLQTIGGTGNEPLGALKAGSTNMLYRTSGALGAAQVLQFGSPNVIEYTTKAAWPASLPGIP